MCLDSLALSFAHLNFFKMWFAGEDKKMANNQQQTKTRQKLQCFCTDLLNNKQPTQSEAGDRGAQNDTQVIMSKSKQCCVCFDESIQQQIQIERAKKRSYRNDDKVSYARCLNCEKRVCNLCISGAWKEINKIPSHLITNDKTVSVLRNLRDLLRDNEGDTHADITIPFGHCCIFKSTISSDATQSITSCRIFHADEDYSYFSDVNSESDDNENCADHDLSFNTHKEAIRKVKKLIDSSAEDVTSVDHLHHYFDNTNNSNNGRSNTVFRPQLIIKRAQKKEWKKQKKKFKKRRRENPRTEDSSMDYNPFEGAFIIPSFHLIITADADNNGLLCDHLAHAKSSHAHDMTPDVSHAVINQEAAIRANEYIKTHNIDLKRISQDRRETIVVKGVESPEGDGRRRDFKIEVIKVRQLIAGQDVGSKFQKCSNDFRPEDISGFHIFGNDDIKDDVDATLIIGEFKLESDATIVGHKLLLLRFSTMMSNRINWGESDQDGKLGVATKLYDYIRSISGKRGFELRRFCGSSGFTTDSSDKDLLCALHIHEGTLPRKVGAVFIVKGIDRYHLVYHKCNDREFATAEYSPPKEGGQFKLPHALLASKQFPFLSEMTYVKILAILIMRSFNEQYSNRFGFVGCGPVHCEMMKILKAREKVSVANLSTQNEKLLCLLKEFNDLHHYSLVSHPVGLHNDTFKEGDESIENKLLLCSLSDKNNIGRGGSVVGRRFVFALLDW